jgi:hypothetical protein
MIPIVPPPSTKMTVQPTPQQAATALRIIRTMLGVAPLFLGGIIFLKRSQAGFRSSPGAQSLEMIAYAVCVAATAALYFVAQRRRRMEDLAARQTQSVIGWAIAESSAFIGAVVMLKGAATWPRALGMFVVALSWALIPADPQQA